VAVVLALLAGILVAAGYLLGARRGRAREQALQAAIDQRDEKLSVAEHELLRRSSLDPVTKLPGQQALQEFLEREWRRASRERTIVSVIMIEVDHFQGYNDRLGKNEGDACLRAVADAMKPVIHRPSDILARYGEAGKFGVVLGRTDATGAMVIAERLQRAVDALQKTNPASPTQSTLTLSLGLASIMPDRHAAWQDIELIAAAEKGLAQARDSRGNRIAVGTPTETTKSG